MAVPVPNAGTSRNGIREGAVQRVSRSASTDRAWASGIDPTGFPVFVLGGLRRKLDGLVPVSALNLRGGRGRNPYDLPGAATGLAGIKEAPRIVGGDDRIAADGAMKDPAARRLLLAEYGHDIGRRRPSSGATRQRECTRAAPSIVFADRSACQRGGGATSQRLHRQSWCRRGRDRLRACGWPPSS